MFTIEDLYNKTLLEASPLDKRFLEFIHCDIRRFAESPVRETGVLCFPMMHSHFTHLIQMVAELFSFSTCLIGNGRYRFAVVCKSRLTHNWFNLKRLVINYFNNHVIDPFYELYQNCYDARTRQFIISIY